MTFIRKRFMTPEFMTLDFRTLDVVPIHRYENIDIFKENIDKSLSSLIVSLLKG